MDDAFVKKVFEKDTCKMVRGTLVLIQGVWIGTLYKLMGIIIIDGCNHYVVPKIGAENLVVSGESTMLWRQRLGNIREKDLIILHVNGMVQFMSNLSLDFNFFEHYLYGKKIESFSPQVPRGKKGY